MYKPFTDIRRSLPLCCGAMLFASATAAQVAQDQDVQAGIYLAEQWLDTQLNYDGVPGASVAIVHDQELVWSRGFGYARLKGKVEATADTRYSICSVSKLFTGIGVMQLRDAGKLSLDQPIQEILPWYALPEHDKQEEPVTLRAILSHVAGLPREAVTPYWTEVDFPDRGTLQSGTAEQQALYRPYDRFQYSNLGLSLAGEAIAAASGEDFHTYIQASILDPLGMQNTTSELPTELYGKEFAAGYKLRDSSGKRPEVGKYKTNAVAPAAGFASSANDLARFASWQFRLQEQGGTEVLKATTLREMERAHWSAPDLDGVTWGLGFSISKFGNEAWVGHGGYCPGYRTAFLTRPQDKLAVIVMVNVNDVSPAKIASNLILLLKEPILTAVAAAEAPDTAGDQSADETESQDYRIFQGVYGRRDLPIVSAVAATSSGLKAVQVYSDELQNRITDYKPEETPVFRVLSGKGEETHTVRFELDEEGNPLRLWEHGQYLDRVR